MPEVGLHIGSGGKHLRIEPTRREFPAATDYWDQNWLYANVRVQAGAFTGRYEALLRSDEFRDFRDQLAPLYENLIGDAKFESLEEWVRIHVTGDGRGHFLARCTSRDQPGMGNTLTFEIEFDQTAVPQILRDLDELLRAFPVNGAP